MDESFDYIGRVIPATETMFLTPSSTAGGGGGGSTWDTSVHGNDITLTNGNLNADCSNVSFNIGRGSSSHGSGAWYIEFKVLQIHVLNHDTIFVGVMDGTTTLPASLSLVFTVANSVGMRSDNFGGAITGFTAGTLGSGGFGDIVVNDILQVAVDIDNKKVWMGRNNTWANAGNPATGANAAATWVAAYTLYPMWAGAQGNATDPILQILPTSGVQSFSPPAGFTAWG